MGYLLAIAVVVGVAWVCLIRDRNKYEQFFVDRESCQHKYEKVDVWIEKGEYQYRPLVRCQTCGKTGYSPITEDEVLEQEIKPYKPYGLAKDQYVR